MSHLRASVDLILKNLGYAWLPLPAIISHLENVELKCLNLSEGLYRSASFYLNYRDIDRIGPAAKEFLGELRFLTLEQPTSEN